MQPSLQSINALLHTLHTNPSHLPINTLAQVISQPPLQTTSLITYLQSQGCTFDHHPQLGYRLLHTPISFWTDYLEFRTHTPHNFLVYNTTASTQDTAKQLIALEQASQSNLHNTVIIAGNQTAGRGRLGRKWISPTNTAITLSIIRQSPANESEQAANVLTFAASVAVARTVDHFLAGSSHHAHIKWPNDIWVNRRKIAGILVETLPAPTTGPTPQTGHAILGIGLNVSLQEHQIPQTLRDQNNYTPTSLSILGKSVDRLPVLAHLISELDIALSQSNTPQLLASWRKRCLQFNQTVRCKTGNQTFAGTVVDLDPKLGLILRNHLGQLTHLPAQTTTLL